MRWEQQVRYASISDIGFRRQNNQDDYVVRVSHDQAAWKKHGHLFLIADGMGGHAVGELASKLAAETVPHILSKSKETRIDVALRHAIEQANATIHERSRHNREFERMGTTCSALALTAEGAWIGHVGDSRVYRIRGKRIEQLTFDHSLHWELLRRGKTNPEEIFPGDTSHVITRSLGPEANVNVDIEGPLPIYPGDAYLICSDGLTSHVRDSEIGMIARALAPSEACHLLVNLANLRGGSDNITVLIAAVGIIPDDVSAEDEPEDSSSKNTAGSWWMAGFLLIAMAFVMAGMLWLFARYLEGVFLAGAAAFAGVGLFALWLELRARTGARANAPDSSRTQFETPYRTASAGFDRRLLNELARYTAQLERIASEEDWKIDRPKQTKLLESAARALTEGRQRAAFIEFARSLEVLMVGLQEQRKQSSHEQKWGKKKGEKLF